MGRAGSGVGDTLLLSLLPGLQLPCFHCLFSHFATQCPGGLYLKEQLPRWGFGNMWLPLVNSSSKACKVNRRHFDYSCLLSTQQVRRKLEVRPCLFAAQENWCSYARRSRAGCSGMLERDWAEPGEHSPEPYWLEDSVSPVHMASSAVWVQQGLPVEGPAGSWNTWCLNRGLSRHWQLSDLFQWQCFHGNGKLFSLRPLAGFLLHHFRLSKSCPFGEL